MEAEHMDYPLQMIAIACTEQCVGWPERDLLDKSPNEIRDEILAHYRATGHAIAFCGEVGERRDGRGRTR